MPQPLARRMRALAQSDIRRMTLECDRIGGINLGQGICDLPTIPELRDGLEAADRDNRSTSSRYDGIEALRGAVHRRLAEKNGVAYDREGEIGITVGSTGAFAMAALALLDPGDEVLLPEPFRDRPGTAPTASSTRPGWRPFPAPPSSGTAGGRPWSGSASPRRRPTSRKRAGGSKPRLPRC